MTNDQLERAWEDMDDIRHLSREAKDCLIDGDTRSALDRLELIEKTAAAWEDVE